MAKTLKERVVAQAVAGGLAERGGFEPKAADWLHLAELLDAGDDDGARRWAADFDVPLAMLPILARIKPEVARLTPIAAEREALHQQLELAREQDVMVGRIQPASVAEVEAAAAKRMELRKEISRLTVLHNRADEANRHLRQLVVGFSELFDGEPSRAMREGCPAEIYNAILAAGFNPSALYSRSWREVCRREPAKRRPRFTLRGQ